MDVIDKIIIFLALWTMISALSMSSLDSFIALELVGILMGMTVGYYHLSKLQRLGLRPLADILLIIFTIAVLKSIYIIASQ